MRIAVLILICGFIADGALAVECPEESYILENQADVDALGALQCSQITGTLYLRGEAIDNIERLENIVSVGELTVYGTQLKSLKGLDNLISTGYLGIDSNTALENLDSIGGTSVEGSVVIWGNSALENIDGLYGITEVTGNLYLFDNPALRDVDGLANLRTVGEHFYIFGHDSLTDVDGLITLRSTGFDLAINDNQSLKEVDGLANLTEVGRGLNIARNDSLRNLNGLVSVNRIGFYLEVSRNAILSECKGIAPVLGWPDGPPNDNIGLGLEDPIRLGQWRPGAGGPNGDGCNTVEEILSGVSAPTAPIITNIHQTRDNLKLNFQESTTTDELFRVSGYNASCRTNPLSLSQDVGVEILDSVDAVEKTLQVDGFANHFVSSSPTVSLDITHSDTSHLMVSLISPSGTITKLWDSAYQEDENLIGSFPTELSSTQSLEGLVGEPINGEWKLSVQDIEVGPLVREGILNSWGMTIPLVALANGDTTPINLAGLVGSRQYSCTVSAVSKLGVGPDSASLELRPLIEIDSDLDDVLNESDNCPDVANNAQIDTDSDYVGDACDSDDDNDGVNDIEDAFPLDAAEAIDTDGDGIGNNADTDDDGDGISDQYDQFPLETNQPPLQWQRFDDLLESVKGAVNQ